MMADSVCPPPAATERSVLCNELARRYAARIRRHAARVARRLPRHVAMADLVSAGYAGLVDACARFDVQRMDSFEAYVDHRIRGAILDELRSYDPLTRDQRVFARRVSAVTHQLSVALGRAPEDHEIAEALGMTVAQLQDRLARMNTTAAYSTAVCYEDQTEVEQIEANRPDEITERYQQHTLVQAAIERLPERQRLVLRLYYDEGMTLRQIADVLGVTESRVSQIHAEAIGRLRAMVADDGPTPHPSTTARK